MSDPVILALLGGIGAGCLVVFKYLIGEIKFYRDRLLTSMDTTDEALVTAKEIAAPIVGQKRKSSA